MTEPWNQWESHPRDCNTCAIISRVHEPSTRPKLATIHPDALWEALPETQRELLVRYTGLVYHYNSAAKLTGLQSRPEILDSLVKESLALLPFLRRLQPKLIADIGSGAGVPGIPLAVAFPDAHFTLYERSGKKASFLNIAVGALELKNAEVIAADPLETPPGQPFDIVASRGALPLGELVAAARHVLVPSGSLVGFASEAMLGDLRKEAKVHGCSLALAQYTRPGEAESFVYALRYGGAR